MEEVKHDDQDLFWDACSVFDVLDCDDAQATGVLKDSGNDDLGQHDYTKQASGARRKRKVCGTMLCARLCMLLSRTARGLI